MKQALMGVHFFIKYGILLSHYKNHVFGMVRWLQLMCIACIALKLWHTRDAQSAPVYALKVAGVWKVSV